MNTEPMLIFESLYAEIERLKAENETLRAANASFVGGMHWRNGLIAELCDALETYTYPGAFEELVQRAREATHGT